ncbi:hypothetical protein NO932_12865 [Pelagibacterium sp. 26DY04]|uniref:hypothetical protein n=1 Tax=Pelagibacterium sp. 26DY04 TaxID=2967130 RepID=UPI00281552C2|nr:hypothetical protein [Pelagibacterium sp. 26DY04]WMT85813.1 hypothetical protein NO932_12865 [Pelagibacterium sp. 26DY04]
MAEFKKRHGNVPSFEADDIIDYGLMELAGQVSSRRLIDDGQPDMLQALVADADRKVLRRTLVVKVREQGVVTVAKLDLQTLKPDEFFALDIVDVQPKRRVTPTALEVVRRDMKLMQETGETDSTYGAFLRRGG